MRIIKKIQHAAGLLLIPLLCIFTTGCWNRRELQNLTINSALGFDRTIVNGTPGVLLSVLTLKPVSAAGGGGAATRPQVTPGEVVSVTGETIEDAVRNWDLRSSRQLFTGHTRLLLIGESMAREGITQIIDFGTRSKDMPLRAWVVTCRGSAKDALQAQPEFEPLTSTEISNIIYKNPSFVSKTSGNNLIGVMYDLLTPGKEPVIPFLKTFTPQEASAAGRSPAGGAGGGKEKQPNMKTFSVSGLAVFRGDRLAGYLSEEESQGYEFIRNRARGGIIPVSFNSSQKNTSFLFRNVRTRVKPVVSEAGIIFEIRVKGTGEILEEKDAAFDITRERDLRKVEHQVNREVERRCLIAVSKAQQLRSDVFGFGDILHRNNPEVWRGIRNRWDEIFPGIKVKIEAGFTVEHTGLTGKPIKEE